MALKQELEGLRYHCNRIRVILDDRDIAGGQKKWAYIKKGVPIRVEVGPRDIKSGTVFVGRRDQPKSTGMDRSEFVSNLTSILDEIQQGLFDRALAHRVENTVEIDSLDEFKAFFTPKNQKSPETHGGFASCHFVDTPEIDEILKPLKVTPRCIPLEQKEEGGTCIFTGKPSQGRAIFAKSY